MMNCLLTAILRVMTFCSIAAIAWLEYGYSDDDNASATQDFYEKALVVLFDFPDFSIISAYALLFLVWCEAFLQVLITAFTLLRMIYSFNFDTHIGSPPLVKYE